MTETPLKTQLLGTALWRTADCASLDIMRLHSFDQGYLLNGHVLTVFAGRPHEVHYAIVCDHGWATREAHVVLAHDDDSRTIHLRRDALARWWQGERLIDELAGAMDVDISVTPATNTLPIRRLSLAIGHAAPADAAWIRIPEMVIERLPQHYTRTSEHGYRYESGNGEFTAALTVDDNGVVMRYGELWERIAPQ